MLIKINSPKSSFQVAKNGIKITGPKSAIAKLSRALSKVDKTMVISFTLCTSGVPTSIHIYRSLANYAVLSNPEKTELIIYPDRPRCIVIEMEV